MLKTIRNVVLVPFTAAGTYIAAVFSGVIDEDVATPEGFSCFVHDEWALRMSDPPPPPETGIRVLVARLEMDSDGRQTRHVADSLRAAPGFEVQELCRGLALGHGRDTSVAMKAAREQGRRWLIARNGAILVWGQVEQEDKSVRLRLLTRDSESNDRFLTLDDDLTLPEDFAPSLAVTLYASALSQAAELGQSTAAESRGSQFVADRLGPIIPALRELSKSIATLPNGQAQSLRDVYLSTLSTMWSQTGDIAFAQEAFAFSEAELARLTEDDHQGRATAQYWHARALQLLGSRVGSDAMIEGAIAEYRSATSLWTRERASLSWAQAQSGVASALRVLGQRRDDPSLIEEALRTYDSVLEEFTREKTPLNWARTKNSIGATLRALGETRGDGALLEQAIAAHRAALEEATRKKAPLLWAFTQSSLATALSALGSLRKDPALLQDAIAAYGEALKERRRDQLPIGWARTQVRLGDAHRALGSLQQSEQELERAIAAYRSGLEVLTEEAMPIQFAEAQSGTGQALAELAAMRADQALYSEAIEALGAALAVYEKSAVTGEAAALQSELEAAQKSLAALRHGGSS